MSGAPESAWERAFEEWNRGLVPGGPHSIAYHAGWRDAVEAAATLPVKTTAVPLHVPTFMLAVSEYRTAILQALDPASRPEGGRGEK